MITPLHKVPSPADLIALGASELAILAALDTTLEASIAAVLFANPEVLHASPYDDCAAQTPEVWIAEAFVAEARTLRAIIDRYRHAIYVADERMRHDRDFPF